MLTKQQDFIPSEIQDLSLRCEPVQAESNILSSGTVSRRNRSYRAAELEWQSTIQIN